MHGNQPFLDTFGASCLGQPAREVMVGLPEPAFTLMDRVLAEGRPLARDIVASGRRYRFVVVPRRDPETNEIYGVTTHLRPTNAT
jgi:hypothetical protein